jgi:hypothetical protein
VQALIIKDLYDCEDSYQELKNLLKDFKIFEISSIRYFEDIKHKFSYNEPCLFFVNIFTRFPNLNGILNFHKKNNFSALTINNQIVSFMPSKVKLNENKNSIVCLDSVFKLANMEVTSHPLSSTRPTLFMLTYGRDDYLKLSLNSLLHNLESPCDIKIGLNTDNIESEKLLISYQEKYDFIEILKFNKNSYISGFSLLYQIFKPDRFIIFEDDFILPDSFKKYYPNWAYQFIKRLDYFDVVTVGATLDNAPFNWGFDRSIHNGYVQGDWELINEFNKKFLMGQLFAVKSDFYLKVLNKYVSESSPNNTKKYYTPTDKEIYKEAVSICSPSLRGYHIGWNEGMDGFKKNYDKYKDPDNSYLVTSLRTSKVYDLKLKDILMKKSGEN